MMSAKSLLYCVHTKGEANYLHRLTVRRKQIFNGRHGGCEKAKRSRANKLCLHFAVKMIRLLKAGVNQNESLLTCLLVK